MARLRRLSPTIEARHRGRTLEVRPLRLDHGRLRHPRVHFEAKWADHAEPWLERPNAGAASELSLARLIELAVAEGSGEVVGVAALTTYAVEVLLAGEARRYRAAVVWGEATSKSDLRMRLQDYVTGGLAQAVTSTAEVTPATTPDQLELPPLPPLSTKIGPRCVGRDYLRTKGTMELKGFAEHDSGLHSLHTNRIQLRGL